MEHIEWETFLPEDLNPRADACDKHVAIFSLLVYLDISLASFLIWLFSCTEHQVRLRASRFLSYHHDYEIPFAPKVIWDLWHKFPKSIPFLHQFLVTPCAHDIALAESDVLIADSSLRIRVSNCTLKSLKDALNPFALVTKFREHSPFVFGLLMTLAAAPNNYRKRKASRVAKEAEKGIQSEEESSGESSGEESEDDTDSPEFTRSFADFAHWDQDFKFFNVKALVPIVFIISILLFNRHSRVNILALPTGLLLRIGGANKRLMGILSSIGLCVSYLTVERLKESLTNDAIRLAQALMAWTNSFWVVFDNINVYLRKFDQRLTSANKLLNLTNIAIIAMPSVSEEAFALKPLLDLRGNRAKASAHDIIITPDESAHMEKAMAAMVASLLIAYCPNSSSWPDHKEMKAKVAEMTPTDRPLPVEKTETYPFGVHDINEATKRGCLQVIECIYEKSTLTEEEWVEVVRIIMGDHGTVKNLRAARRERADDVSALEQLLNLKELSALWHYGLNALHMLVKVHLGNPVNDPGSLASHKGILGRVWDVNKPDYAAAKSLVRHSLIARILSIVMELKEYKLYSQLSTWKPEFDEVAEISTQIVQEFARPGAATSAQSKGDDWLAHSMLFIRDSLIFLIFESYVSMADPGGILRVLKFWAHSFRGAGMWNYARECLEVLCLWKYELPAPLKAALEKSWFVNKWGKLGRWIPTDLYLEHMNFWVKRVFIAQGSGVTADYMARKGSACVEAFQDITHKFAQFTGTQDPSRRHKEAKFHLDIRALVNHMQKHKLHKLSLHPRSIAAESGEKNVGRSGIKDVLEVGASALFNGAFEEFIKTTTFDPALGWPLDGSHDSAAASDHAGFSVDDELTLETGGEGDPLAAGSGALGGGSDFD